MPKREPTYCDNCGEIVFISKANGDRGKPRRKFHEFTEVPYNVESANQGESAIVCDPCHRKLSPRQAAPDPHVGASPDGCLYYFALQKIGSKLDASKDGRISSSDFREILQDTISAEMIDFIIDPLPIDHEEDD